MSATKLNVNAAEWTPSGSTSSTAQGAVSTPEAPKKKSKLRANAAEWTPTSDGPGPSQSVGGVPDPQSMQPMMVPMVPMMFHTPNGVMTQMMPASPMLYPKNNYNLVQSQGGVQGGAPQVNGPPGKGGMQMAGVFPNGVPVFLPTMSPARGPMPMPPAGFVYQPLQQLQPLSPMMQPQMVPMPGQLRAMSVQPLPEQMPTGQQGQSLLPTQNGPSNGNGNGHASQSGPNNSNGSVQSPPSSTGGSSTGTQSNNNSNSGASSSTPAQAPQNATSGNGTSGNAGGSASQGTTAAAPAKQTSAWKTGSLAKNLANAPAQVIPVKRVQSQPAPKQAAAPSKKGGQGQQTKKEDDKQKDSASEKSGAGSLDKSSGKADKSSSTTESTQAEKPAEKPVADKPATPAVEAKPAHPTAAQLAKGLAPLAKLEKAKHIEQPKAASKAEPKKQQEEPKGGKGKKNKGKQQQQQQQQAQQQKAEPETPAAEPKTEASKPETVTAPTQPEEPLQPQPQPPKPKTAADIVKASATILQQLPAVVAQTDKKGKGKNKGQQQQQEKQSQPAQQTVSEPAAKPAEQPAESKDTKATASRSEAQPTVSTSPVPEQPKSASSKGGRDQERRTSEPAVAAKPAPVEQPVEPKREVRQPKKQTESSSAAPLAPQKGGKKSAAQAAVNSAAATAAPATTEDKSDAKQAENAKSNASPSPSPATAASTQNDKESSTAGLTITVPSTTRSPSPGVSVSGSPNPASSPPLAGSAPAASKAQERLRTLSMSEEAEAESKLESSIKKFSSDHKYSRDFLLSMREKYMERPAGMPDIEAIVGRNQAGSGAGPRKQEYRANGYPDKRYAKGNNNLRSPRGGRGGRGRRTQDEPLLDESEIVPLAMSEDRYQIKRDLESDEKVLRNFQSILNKLTPDKFDVLVEQVLQLDINHSELLKGVVKSVFEKALQEPGFSPTYAQFVATLSERLPPLADSDASSNKAESFKKLLLNQCQVEFESKDAGLSEDDLSKLGSDERQDKENKQKRRLRGTIRFIGELYGRKMLTSRIIYHCIGILYGDANNPASDENLEALCNLLTTVGKYLEVAKGTPSGKEFTDELFGNLENLIKPDAPKPLSSRIRFAIKDVIELRSRAWIPRIKKVEAKKIAEIHKEAAKDPARIGGPGAGRGKPAGSAPSTPNKKGRDNRERPGAAPGPAKEKDDWETVGKGAKKSQDIRSQPNSRQGTPAKPGKSLRSPETPSRGGQRGAGGSNQGSSSGGNASSSNEGGKKQILRADAQNAYSLLDADEDANEDGEQQQDSGKKDKESDAGEEASSSSDQKDKPAETAEEEKTEAQLSPEDEEKIRSKLKGALREFFSGGVKDDFKQTVQELSTSAGNNYVVSDGFLFALEQKESHRTMYAELLVALCEAKIVSPAHVRKGLGVVLDQAEDLVMDAPKALEHLAALLHQLIAAKVLPLSFLVSPAIQPIQESGKASKLLADVLTALLKSQGEDATKAMFKANVTKEQLTSCLPDGGDAAEFLTEKKLDVLVASLA